MKVRHGNQRTGKVRAEPHAKVKPGPQAGSRACISILPSGDPCKNEFTSSWPGERICPACRRRFKEVRNRARPIPLHVSEEANEEEDKDDG